MSRWGKIERNERLTELEKALRTYHEAVSGHAVYSNLTSLPQVHKFMETHVFAVWDFMSLLSAIRSRLTCMTLPWRPAGTAETRRFINELYLAEDSDLHPDGSRYTSHFELYVEAMRTAGADTNPIEEFTGALGSGLSIQEALLLSAPAPHARKFVEDTWQVIANGTLAELMGAFTFGRENLIPAMFEKVRRLALESPELDPFVSYLDRHIELDGGEHAPVAFRIVEAVCSDSHDAWEDAFSGGRRALLARMDMWDSLHQKLERAANDTLIN